MCLCLCVCTHAPDLASDPAGLTCIGRVIYTKQNMYIHTFITQLKHTRTYVRTYSIQNTLVAYITHTMITWQTYNWLHVSKPQEQISVMYIHTYIYTHEHTQHIHIFTYIHTYVHIRTHAREGRFVVKLFHSSFSTLSLTIRYKSTSYSDRRVRDRN